MKNTISIRLLVEITVTCGLIFAIGIPRLSNLDRFVTTDERLWLERSGKFYYALAHRDFKATFQKSHPGVTVMWAGLTGYMRVYPSYSDSQKGQDRPVGINTLAKRDFSLPLQILAAGRRTMALLNLLALILGFLYARRLFGIMPALVGFSLIALDPFHIALSKVLHLDGLLANLMLLSLLAFLSYLDEHKKTALAVSAVAAGLAWLTKSPGLFLVPLMVLLTLFDLIRSKSDWIETGWQKPVLKYLGVLTAWGVIGMFTFILLWPAMWTDPLGSLAKIFADAVGYAQSGHNTAVFFNGIIYPDGEIPDISFYPTSFLWRTTPITLLGLLALPVLLILRRRVYYPDPPGPENIYEGTDRQRWAITALVLFSVGFVFFINMGLKKFDRYIIPSITPLDLVAGISLVWLARWIGLLLPVKWRSVLTGLILFGFVAFQAELAWTATPYYFNYYNPLLGGAQRATEVMQIGWGEGLDQAARYLNDKPNSDQIKVIAWYGSGPFSYFSKSQVSPLDVDHQWSPDDWDMFNKSDYAVIYIHEWQRNLPAEVLDRLRSLEPEYSVWIDGLEYVRIYKIQ